MNPTPRPRFQPHRRWRRIAGPIFGAACLLATLTGVLVLALLLGSILAAALQGPPDHPWYAIGPNLAELFALVRNLATRPQSINPLNAGYRVGIVGSLWLLGLVALIGIPVGIGAGRVPRGVCPARPIAMVDPDEHRQPGRRALDRLRHPGTGPLRACLRDQGPGPGPDPAGRRPDPEPARSCRSS